MTFHQSTLRFLTAHERVVNVVNGLGFRRRTYRFVICFGAIAVSCPPLLAASENTFMVTKGMTLGEISTLLYGTVKRSPEIVLLNHLNNPDLIYAGQELKLPGPPTIVVQPEVKAPDETNETNEEKEFSAYKEKEENAKPQAEKTAVVTAAAALNNKDYETAAASFKSARTLNASDIPSWLSEIHSYLMLGQSQKAHQVASEFIEKFPHLSGLPVIRASLKLEQEKKNP